MILKKITLNNIRSYENAEVEFKEGSTLLTGDIGSGKTSILLAIEFALFGLQPGQRGFALLRNGKKEGSVIINFEIDGKDIIIERNLKRGKSVSQDYCSIIIDGEKSEIAVTELKNKILQILAYPPEFSKKQNILYKYTVYTPQEEMKEIILQDSETRINTLRYVFGIDKYKRILENASIFAGKLREEKRTKEGMIYNLEQDKLIVMEKEEEIEIKKYNLISAEKEFSLKKNSTKQIYEEQQKILKKIEEKRNFEKEIEKTNIMLSTKNDSLISNKKTTEQLKMQITELEKLKFDESKVLILEKEISSLNQRKQELNEQNLNITSKISSLNIKNQDNENIREKISQLEICPTCLQDVDPNYKANVINQLDSNTSENIKNIRELSIEKRKISENILEIENNISNNEKSLRELTIMKIKFQNIKEKQSQLEQIQKFDLSLEKDIELLNQHIFLLKNSVFELSKYDNIFQEKQKQLDSALQEERFAEIKVAELKKEIDLFTRQINELKERIRKTEEIKERLNYISSLEDWLIQKFSPVITFIEKNVMIKLKSEFSKLFAEWFSMLVSDTFNIRLDDNFTPIVEQQDYEIDYAYLSGGERTAVALAYRLALNQVINSLISKLKTRDLVILDEPTDGFSETQLDKMRDVLQELNVKQLIIVSHEQKIEGFVENVIRLKKEEGVRRKEEE